MPERSDTYSGPRYTAPIIFSRLAQTATADAGDVLIFRAPEKMVIDKVVAVTSTAYTSGDATDEIDVLVNVAGSQALRIDGTFATLSAVGSRLSAEAGATPISVAAGALVDVDLDITEVGTFALAGG